MKDMASSRILVIDDDPSMLDLARFHLLERGFEVITAGTAGEGMQQVEAGRIDLALTDFSLPDLDGIEVVRRIRETSPETQVIMVTGYGSVSTAVEATKAGAFYFVEKPVDFDELMILVEKAIEHGRQAAEIRQLRDRLIDRTSYYNIIGSSKAMQNIYEIIESVAESDANIFIVGESGTGKELIANAIHYRSRRAKKPFVKINCAALPKELIESELFGHTKGAFTGAASEKIGLIGQAEGGSLMLDEITEMPLELQPKLLRVLQERIYRRLGGEKNYPADFRLISATNRDPREAVGDGSLREDLYYRVNTIEIRVPPLRERVSDIQHLAEYFIQSYAQKYGRSVTTISQEAYARLFAYHWPGNVRELQNAIERAVLLSKNSAIEESDLPLEHMSATPTEPAALKAAPGAAVVPPAEMTLDQIGRLIVSRVPENQNNTGSDDLFKQLEGVIVSAALERTKGNKQAAANLLGVYRPRLYSMIKKHNLGSADEEAEESQEMSVAGN
jgi:DNA-binding NtrC family response regulator